MFLVVFSFLPFLVLFLVLLVFLPLLPVLILQFLQVFLFLLLIIVLTLFLRLPISLHHSRAKEGVWACWKLRNWTVYRSFDKNVLTLYIEIHVFENLGQHLHRTATAFKSNAIASLHRVIKTYVAKSNVQVILHFLTQLRLCVDLHLAVLWYLSHSYRSLGHRYQCVCAKPRLYA